MREAIADASTNAAITFDPAVFNTTQKIVLTSGPLIIAKNLDIRGPGAGLLAIDGNHTDSVFIVQPGVITNISGLVIQEGTSVSGGGLVNRGTLTLSHSLVSDNSSDEGGGILNQGELTIDDSAISGNVAREGGGVANDNLGKLTLSNITISANLGFSGGGIFNNGLLSVDNSRIFDNKGFNDGGGITVSAGVVDIDTSLFSGNEASSGGGIFNAPGDDPTHDYSDVAITSSTFINNAAAVGSGIDNASGTLTVGNSTFADNEAGVYPGGGIVIEHGNATIGNSTISGNKATVGGGGGIIVAATGSLNLLNNIIAGNLESDINGKVISLGNNLIGNTDGVTGLVTSDQQNVDPKLKLVASTLPIFALQDGSPAIGKGNCTLKTETIRPLTTDQRGAKRRTPCDIGAYESAGQLDF